MNPTDDRWCYPETIPVQGDFGVRKVDRYGRERWVVVNRWGTHFGGEFHSRERVTRRALREAENASLPNVSLNRCRSAGEAIRLARLHGNQAVRIGRRYGTMTSADCDRLGAAGVSFAILSSVDDRVIEHRVN